MTPQEYLERFPLPEWYRDELAPDTGRSVLETRIRSVTENTQAFWRMTYTAVGRMRSPQWPEGISDEARRVLEYVAAAGNGTQQNIELTRYGVPLESGRQLLASLARSSGPNVIIDRPDVIGVRHEDGVALRLAQSDTLMHPFSVGDSLGVGTAAQWHNIRPPEQDEIRAFVLAQAFQLPYDRERQEI